MSIFYHETSQEFHLKNESVSYIMKVLKNGQIGQLYYGSAIPDKEDFGYYIETMHRPMSSYLFEGNLTYSLEHLKQEYPSYGTTDYREPAFEILQENGSRISDFVYESHKIYDGKPELQGLPAVYVEEKEENTQENLKVESLDDLFEDIDAPKKEEKNKKSNVMDNNKQDGGINLFDLGNDEEENLTKSETKEDDEYDLQKELEAKFDELFGPIDD